MDLMISIYCRNNHHTSQNICEECESLKAYAHLRLLKCPYQEQKTTCAHCPTHCYKRSMRDQVRVVMRYAGPRMLWWHPIYAFLHIWDGFRKTVQMAKSPRN